MTISELIDLTSIESAFGSETINELGERCTAKLRALHAAAELLSYYKRSASIPGNAENYASGIQQATDQVVKARKELVDAVMAVREQVSKELQLSEQQAAANSAIGRRPRPWRRRPTLPEPPLPGADARTGRD
jgi:hypothetical protein